MDFVTIGTGGVTGVYYPAGGAICLIVNKGRKDHGIRCSVESTGGSVFNLNTIRAGDMDLGIAQSDWQFHAFYGTSRFQDQGPFKDLRSVFSLHPEPFTVVARADASSLSWRDVEAVLEPIRGEVLQRPPSYSAIKRDGEPAYRAARRGTPHELEPRLVTVYSLALVDFTNPRLTIEVECGKGFYVRSLAHDIGATLGVGGHLSALRRTAVGPFTVGDAVPLDRAVQRLEQGDVETLLHAPDAVLAGWPAVIVGPRSLAALQHGLDLRPEPRALRRAGREGERARCYGPDGRLAALLEGSAIPGAWHPYRVFSGIL